MINGPRGKTKYPQRAWALSNFGMLRGVFRTRKEAIDYCEHNVAAPWSNAKRYMEVWKCTVTPERTK